MTRREFEQAIMAMRSTIHVGAPRSISVIHAHAEVDQVADLAVRLGLVNADDSYDPENWGSYSYDPENWDDSEDDYSS